MKISLRHIGYGGGPSEIIEMIIESSNTSITEDVTEWNSKLVDESIIENLRDIANELEEQNEKAKNQ